MLQARPRPWVGVQSSGESSQGLEQTTPQGVGERGTDGPDPSAYERILGETVGGFLHDKLLDAVTAKRFQQIAGRVFDQLSGMLGGVLKDQSDEDVDGAYDAFTSALASALKEKVPELLGDPEFEELSSWARDRVENNPALVFLAGLFAGAAAYATDMALNVSLGVPMIGPLSGRVSSDLGSLQNIVWKNLRGEIDATVLGIQWRALGEVDKDAQWWAGAGMFLGLDALQVDVSGQWDDKGFRTGRLATWFSNALGQLQNLSGGKFLPDGVTYDANLGALRFANARDRLWNADTKEKDIVGGYLDVERPLARRERPEGSPYDWSTDDKAALGFLFTSKDFQATFDAQIDLEAKKLDAVGTLSWQGNKNIIAGLDATVNNLSGSWWEVGGYFGFQDAAAFKSYVVSYAYRSDIARHRIGLVIENALQSVHARFTQRLTLSPLGNELDTRVLGEHQGVGDISFLGGLEHRYDFEGHHQLVPELGIQVGNIPLLVGYDFGSKKMSFEITFPLGSDKRRTSWR